VIRRDDYLRKMIVGDLLECTEPQLFRMVSEGEEFDPYKIVVERVYSRCINESFDRNKAQNNLREEDYRYLSGVIDDLK
ncbi:hypothetical protein ACXWO0_11065, partial [Streptococcus pyogenes]